MFLLLKKKEKNLIMNFFPLFFALKKVCVEYCTTEQLYVEQTLDTEPKKFEKLYKCFPMNQMWIAMMQRQSYLQHEQL